MRGKLRTQLRPAPGLRATVRADAWSRQLSWRRHSRASSENESRVPGSELFLAALAALASGRRLRARRRHFHAGLKNAAERIFQAPVLHLRGARRSARATYDRGNRLRPSRLLHRLSARRFQISACSRELSQAYVARRRQAQNSLGQLRALLRRNRFGKRKPIPCGQNDSTTTAPIRRKNGNTDREPTAANPEGERDGALRSQ